MSLEGFALCMQVLQRLRQSYSAADYATHFLEAAIKKAGIPVESHCKHASRRRAHHHQWHSLSLQQKQQQQQQQQQQPLQLLSPASTFSSGGGLDRTISIPATAPPSNAGPTPPPDMESLDTALPPPPPPAAPVSALDESDLQLKLEAFLQAPPSPVADMDSFVPLDQHQSGDKSLFGGLDSSSVPDFSMPDTDDDDLGVFLGGGASGGGSCAGQGGNGNCDPFLGHDGGVPGTYPHHQHSNHAVQNLSTRELELEMMWSESGLKDMSKILDGVDMSFDDVIQVLETEIN